MTQWGVFSLSQFPDQSKRVECFDNDLKFFKLAETLGYDKGWIAEHLFSTYGVVTSTQVYASAIAKCTTKLRIGIAVVAMPFNHPLRTASDFALVDVLSHGRLDFGIGRAYQPHEFVGLGVPMEDSRAMTMEAADVVLRAWTEEKITHRGQFWTIPDPVEVLPKPVQQPTPPIYMAVISPESFELAGRKGWNLQMASPFSYRTYREGWIDAIEKSCKVYADAAAKADHDLAGLKRMILLPFFCHEDGAKAREIYKPPVEWFYNKVASNQLSQKATGPVKGYELTMTEGSKTRDMGYLGFDKLYEYGAAIADDPETCIKKLKDLKRRLGVTEFALWFNVGGIAPEHVERSMRLTAEKVMPYV